MCRSRIGRRSRAARGDLRMLAKHRVLIGTLAIVALILIVSFFIPLYGEICTEGHKESAKECATYHLDLVILWKIFKTLDLLSALITAAATVAIGTFTWAIRSVNHKQ